MLTMNVVTAAVASEDKQTATGHPRVLRTASRRPHYYFHQPTLKTRKTPHLQRRYLP